MITVLMSVSFGRAGKSPPVAILAANPLFPSVCQEAVEVFTQKLTDCLQFNGADWHPLTQFAFNIGLPATFDGPITGAQIEGAWHDIWGSRLRRPFQLGVNP
jgi:hypothetical protein